jgi:hypothetical protein
MSKKLDHWLVYGLFDPITGAIRYIGQTSYELSHRLSRHLYEAKHQKVCDAKRDWILSLALANERPVIRSLQRAETEEEACALEDDAIKSWRAVGACLLNEAGGGLGSPGRVLREETKAKIGAANTGRTVWMKGRCHSPEVIERLRAAKLGKPNPMKGKKHPPEFGEKLRAIKASRPNPLKGRPLSAETRAKISASKMGKPRKSATASHPSPV